MSGTNLRLHEELADLPGLMAAWAEESRAVGLSVGVLRGDESELFVLGLANRATGQAVCPETLFQIGSTTKLWTATVVMQLVDDEQVELDAPVTRYVPEFTLRRADADRITIKHLLTHTGGFLGDFFGTADDASAADFVTAMRDLEQLHPPGAGWSYCNSGFVLLGRVIEKVTGLPYAAAVRTLLLEPLGAADTNMAGDFVEGRSALGYVLDVATGHPVERPYRTMSAYAPAGSVPVSTQSDVLRFVRLHLDEGRTAHARPLLSPETVDLMQRQHAEVPSALRPTIGLGLGWMRATLPTGDRVIGHTGSTPAGHRSLVEVLPDRRIAVVVLSNSPEGAPIAVRVVDHVFERIVGAKLTAPPVTWPQPPLELDWRRYAGVYAAGGAVMQVDVADDGSGLMVRMTSPVTGESLSQPQAFALRPLDPTSFAQPVEGASSVIQFQEFDVHGRPQAIFRGRLYPRVATAT